jgi:hypothetical protein
MSGLKCRIAQSACPAASVLHGFRQPASSYPGPLKRAKRNFANWWSSRTLTSSAMILGHNCYSNQFYLSDYVKRPEFSPAEGDSSNLWHLVQMKTC